MCARVLWCECGVSMSVCVWCEYECGVCVCERE